MLIWNGGAGFTLTEANFMCGVVANPAESSCATWQTANFPHCVRLLSMFQNNFVIVSLALQKCHSLVFNLSKIQGPG